MKTKLYLLSLLLVTTSELFSKNWSSLTINHQSFALLEEYYDEYNSKGKTVTFYKQEQDGNRTSLFSFVLNDATGECNDKSIEEGSYEVNGTILSLYTLWKRQGSIEDAPYGGKIERYEVLKNGELNHLSSELYIETHAEEYDKESGMRFLFETPTTQEDKKQLKNYVRSVEKIFHGKFLFSKEAASLMREVNSAISRKKKNLWKKRD